MQTIKSVILLENFKDRLGRKYSRSELEQQTAGIEFYGELDVGEGTDVDLSRVSHVVKNVVVSDNSVIGDVVFLATPMGQIASTLIDNDIKLRTSIRALGSVDKDLNVTDLKLIAFDLIKEA